MRSDRTGERRQFPNARGDGEAGRGIVQFRDQRLEFGRGGALEQCREAVRSQADPRVKDPPISLLKKERWWN